MTFEQEIFIGFGDADPAGVIFYPRAIALAHDAVEELIRRSSLGWHSWFDSSTHIAPLRRAEANFFAPMRPGETFTARATVEKLGNTSATFMVEFTDDAGNPAARILTTHVLIDKSTGRPVPLTGPIRKAFGDPS